MIASNADIIARFDLRAALANNNATGSNQLSIVALHTEHLGLAIPPIAGATHTFFMCHSLFLCLAFSILGILDLGCTAAARCLLLYFSLRFSASLGLANFPCSCLELSRLWGSLYLLNFRSFLGL